MDLQGASAASVYRDLARVVRSLRSRTGQNSQPLSSLSALWVLIDAGRPIRLSELAERENVTVPTMSRIVTGLERDGLIARTADPDDGRASLLAVTEAGADLIKGSRSRRVQALETALEGLDEAEREVLGRTLRKVADELAERPENA
ncbi:MAG: MarR family transcriptional regulator [Gordonia sp.]|jgi:DNA-binding MarR family transcriptional regulator|uniref:MarR family transcriptional regulator n=1 Tax=Gordonia rubripertincta TaxID=36822 RepID=A0ABT4MX52_GORRU|nr:MULTISPECIES: MarR family transcriptional regulator [Mycobacteriales]MBA4023342.1 MarR family transcriptional regulator [Gordonia sp. (in: high G+C Gram-positive bacteria)]MCZ4551599.1 MarR family transcriptional regulator [Gordonia rubripertincta]OZG26281.1 MarR family transcriptional regulator [Williamsia sp. 1138]